MSQTIEIFAAAARARIATRGAELKSWRVGDQELIWPGDEKYWPDSAPVLFPVVGWTRDGVVVEGKRYPLGLHGFARHETFEFVEGEEDRVLFRLRANDATFALYPFSFALYLEYIIYNSMLRVIISVVNKDKKPLSFACGLHPGFLWPLPGASGAHVVRFDREERADVPRIAPGGLISAQRRVAPLRGRELELKPELFEEALCFLDARSSGLEYRAERGGVLRMELQDFPHIALWSRPGAGFLCLEAWTGHGDPEGFDGDIFAKPSMRLLAPGEKARFSATFSWRG